MYVSVRFEFNAKYSTTLHKLVCLYNIKTISESLNVRVTPFQKIIKYLLCVFNLCGPLYRFCCAALVQNIPRVVNNS